VSNRKISSQEEKKKHLQNTISTKCKKYIYTLSLLKARVPRAVLWGSMPLMTLWNIFAGWRWWKGPWVGLVRVRLAR